MTPSEIADWLENAGWSTAAATIRELGAKLKIAEGDRDVARNDCDMMVERMKRYERELKIATEALEEIGSQTMSMHFTIDGLARHGIRSANEALARMKGVG